MSQIPSDPPPLPVVSLPPEPIYSRLPVHSRPGAIGFMGITSIIIASLCILAGVGFGLMDVGLLLAGSAAKTMATMAPATAPAVPPSAGGSAERLPDDGLPAADRQTIADGFSRIKSLSPAQLEQLDELLAEHGKTIVPNGSTLAPQQLAANIAGGHHLNHAGAADSDSFAYGTGTLEVTSKRAVFIPSDGQPPVRSNAFQIPASTSTGTGLQPQQIQSILRTINDLNGNHIKSAQATTLISTFQNPGQEIIIPPTDGSDPAWQINSATTDADGTLSVACNHGTTNTAINCLADGTVGQSSVSSMTVTTTATAMPTVNSKAAVATLGLTALQLLLAIFLLIAGIATLRNSPSGRMLHWIYVVLKLPIAAMTAAASAWMWNSIIQSVPTGGTATPPAAIWGVSLSMGIMPVALACLYPITLIFVLLSRNVRMFYDAVRAD